MQPFPPPPRADGVEEVFVAVARAAESDFDSYVRAALPRLLRVARAVAGTGDAEDLVQEALVRALCRWDKITAEGDPYPYIRQTIVHLYISSWRRRRRELSFPEAPDLVTPAPEVDDSLWHAVCALPPRQRAAVVLRYYEDLSEERTAEVLRCSVGNVKSQTARALRKLQQVLDPKEAL